MNIKTIIAAITIAFSANTAAIDVGAVKDASCVDKLAALDAGFDAPQGYQMGMSLKNIILPMESGAYVYGAIGKLEKPEIDLQGVRAKITKRNESICDVAEIAFMSDDEKSILAICKDSDDNNRFFKITHNRPVSFYSNATMGAGMQWLKRAKVAEIDIDNEANAGSYGFWKGWAEYTFQQCGIDSQAYDNGFWFF
ncbi:TPA: hypothetical protein JLV92_004640 [Escherichia coli]|uniref:hypothetical protein n=1 Tax=Escherichia coli TaxID=562 RepID=UPI000BDF5D11|nr:hypothetical protein [Escherichia coli]HAW4390710.1 hypothetical protein [Escherichia coli]